MTKRLLLIIFYICVAVFPLCSQQLVEGIVAIVGKEIILKSEIDQYIQSYIVQNRIDVKQNPQLVEELKNQTLEKLIEQKLLLAKADEDTLTVDDEMLDQRVEQRMRYLIEQVGSEDKLETVFGSPLKKIRKDTRKVVKEQLLVEQVRSMKFRNVKVSRREVEEFYKTYKDSLPSLEETINISHILMLVKPSEDAQTAAYNKTSEILDKIKNGGDFSELAEKFSDDPASAKRGGDLGLISRGDFVKEFETAAFNLKDGEISDIVQSQFGFHIIKMIERRGEKIRTQHILIQTIPTQADEDLAVAKLSEIRQRILNGEDFSKLAVEFSDDENVHKDNGNIGEFETEKLAIPEFKTISENMKPGDISEPFKTEFGYHIICLEDRQKKRRLTLENDWRRIEEFTLNFKMEREYIKWIQEFRKSVPIEIRTSS